jgi:hypothetical protein
MMRITYMFQSKGGTAKARTQFQNQLDAVASDTALARIFEGKISDGYVHEVGPQVVANVQTKRYVIATIALETGLLLLTIQEISEFELFTRAPRFGTPYDACRAPTMKRKVIMKKEPMSIEGRRPKRSR